MVAFDLPKKIYASKHQYNAPRKKHNISIMLSLI